MDIEFDPAKDAINRAKHGLALADGAAIFDDPDHLIVETTRVEDGERRFKVIGMMKGKLHSAVFVWRGRRIRFISVRRSNRNEERAYRDPG